MAAGFARVVTAGVFSIDGDDFDVENNVWIVGDESRVIVVDAAHDAEAILAAVGDRRVDLVLLTHGHNDHINAAADVSDRTGARIALHPADHMLWRVVHPEREPDVDLSDGDEFDIGGARLRVLHTPGHSPGAVSFYCEELASVLTGDTLFKGGPGATGRSFSDFPTILDSIRERLLPLPGRTRVLTGHGDETTIGAEAPDYDEWVARGH